MNRVYSTQPLSEFSREGQYIYIRLDEQLEEQEELTQYSYLQTKVKLSGSIKRDMIIESIIRAKYPSYGAELAAMANGEGERLEHQNWRQLAKDKADYFIENFFSISQQ